MKFISLFSGIGGFDLGFERAGMECVAQVEIDEFCQKVLAKHWANVPRFKDVRDVGKHNLPAADLICGGFPCQDVSLAGPQFGLAGKRSTLWSEYFRVICETRPRWIVAENVVGLLASDNGQFFGNVLRDLVSIGYDAEWEVLPASAFGSPAVRERVFVVSYPSGIGRGNVLQAKVINDRKANRAAWEDAKAVLSARRNESEYEGNPELIRIGDGVPGWVDRLRSLGNSIHPAAAEWIGRRIMEAS